MTSQAKTMSELTNIQVTITIEDPNLDNEQLQAETQKMRSQLEELFQGRLG